MTNRYGQDLAGILRRQRISIPLTLKELSWGTIDEFYLACRIALVRLIYGEIRPPLFLDDPFLNFDEPLLMKTFEFLSKLSKEHQIIIFTLQEIYDSIADKIIELT